MTSHLEHMCAPAELVECGGENEGRGPCLAGFRTLSKQISRQARVTASEDWLSRLSAQSTWKRGERGHLGWLHADALLEVNCSQGRDLEGLCPAGRRHMSRLSWFLA